MIVDVIHLLKLRIVSYQSVKLLFAERKVIELILENHSGIVQSVLYDKVACQLLIFAERYLREVVFAFVRVVLCAVLHVA